MKKYLFGKNHHYMYLFDSLFDGVVTTLTAGTFFAKLSTSLGVTDTTTVILSQAGNLMVALFLVSTLISHSHKAKPIIAGLHLCYQLLLSTIYVLPFFLLEPGVAETVLLVILLLAKALTFSSLTARSSWFVSNMPKEKQSTVFGISQGVVNTVLFLVSLSLGAMIDHMEEAGNLTGAFLIIFFILLLMSGLNFATILLTRPPSEEFYGKEKESVLSDFKSLIRNKAFVSVAVQKFIYAIAITAATVYQYTYLVVDIGLSMKEASLFEALGTVVYAVCLTVWGKVGERIRLSRVCLIGMGLMATACLCAAFMTPLHFFVPYLCFILCYKCGYAAFMVGCFVLYRVAPQKEYTSALVMLNIPQCLLTFLTTLLLAPLFDYLKYDLGNVLFGRVFYAQQTFALIGAALFIPAILYLVLVVFKHLKERDTSL